MRTCPEKPQGADPFFPSPLALFNAHWERRKAAGVKLVLDRLRDDGEKQEVLRQLAPQLNDLRL